MPKKKVKKERAQVYMPPHIMAEIKKIADNTESTVSDIVLVAINMYLTTHGEKQ